MDGIYDILIIGGGPAGLTAGIYASRAKMKAAIIEKANLGGQAATTEEVENYPGFFAGSTGPDITAKMAEHAEYLGTEIINANIAKVDLTGDLKTLTSKNGKQYQSKTVILCPGAEPRTLNIKGEGKFRGMGVSYCATCDADFFEDLELLVVGNGDAAIEEAMHLTKFASKVTIVVIHDQGILDCNKASAARAFKNPQIAWIWHSVLDEIKGNDLVESVMIKDLKTNQISELAVSGVFFFVGTIPKTDFIKDQVTLNKQGYIMTNEIMETNLPGVYAAGDARAKYLRQIITSAADGAIAAFAAEKYLVTQEIFQQEILSSEKPVLLIFWTPQQEKTMEAATMLENLAQEHYGSFKAVKMDASRNQNLVSLYQIENLPTILAFKNGKLTGRLNGFSDKKTIENLL